MTNVTIDSDEANNNFIITGDIESLIGIVEIRSYLKNFLFASIEQDIISVPFEVDEKEVILDKILRSFQRYGITTEKSKIVETELQSYFEEESNFNIFSKKAYSIRNNDCDAKEFDEFTSIIDGTMVTRTLYPLQLLSAYHLAFSQNACNFSVPGSGKTTIVYAAYSYLRSLDKADQKHVDHLLIFGPLNSFGPWEQEFEACFGVKPITKRLHGIIPKTERIRTLTSTNPPEIILLPYQGLPGVLNDVIYYLKNNRTMVVLDEAHRIKNVDGGIIANAALEIAKYCKSRVVLTGTPMPNGYQDLLNLFKFIWPNKEIIGYRRYQLEEMSDISDDDRIPNLIENISPYFIRVRKSDLGLPVPVENPPILVTMGPVQRQIYDYIESYYLDKMISAQKGTSPFSDLITRAKLIRLMQAATNPNLLSKPLEEFFKDQSLPDNLVVNDIEVMQTIIKYGQYEVPEKFRIARLLVQDILKRGQKVIIWTSFVQNIFDLSACLSESEIENRIIYGGIPIDLDEDDEPENETRESIIKEFHSSDSSFKVIIANPHAISESISLHKVCHNAIYVDRTFNAGHYIQSKDRIHRYGLQPNDVINYYYLLSDDSVDSVIHSRLQEKEARMNFVIENSSIPLFNNADNNDLADDDIRAILEDYIKRRSEKYRGI